MYEGSNSGVAIGLIVVIAILISFIVAGIIWIARLHNKLNEKHSSGQTVGAEQHHGDDGVPMLQFVEGQTGDANQHQGDDGVPMLQEVEVADQEIVVPDLIAIIARENEEFTRDRYIFHLTTRPRVFADCIQQMSEYIRENANNVNVILGLNGPDTRGELLAARIAGELNLPFAEITESEVSTNGNPQNAYHSEITGKWYTVDMPHDVLALGTNVVIVDNVIYNGETMRAATQLATDRGLEVVLRIGLMKVSGQGAQFQVAPDVVDWTLFDIQV